MVHAMTAPRRETAVPGGTRAAHARSRSEPLSRGGRIGTQLLLKRSNKVVVVTGASAGLLLAAGPGLVLTAAAAARYFNPDRVA